MPVLWLISHCLPKATRHWHIRHPWAQVPDSIMVRLSRHCHLHSEMCQRRQAGRKSGRRSSVLEHFLKNHEIQAQCPQENQPSRHVLFWLSQNLRNLEKVVLSSWPLNWAPKMMCWKAEQNLFAYAHLSYNHWTDKSKSFWIQTDERLRWIA